MCVLWTGARTPDGYPRRLYRGNANQRWHRVVYCQANGLDLSDIAGKVVRHTCDNPLCIDPAHLTLGTVADNNRDRDDRGRHGRRKFSKQVDREIAERYRNGESAKALAHEYGVWTQTIYKVLGRTGG